MTNAVRLAALFLGAGLVIAHVGEVAAFNDVTATTGIAVGRDVTNSTLNAYSRDPEDVQQIARLLADRETLAAARHEAELRAEKLAGEAQTTKQQMLIFLSILAKQEVKPEQVPATMAEITRNYQRQQDNYATLAPQDAGAADLVNRAKQATDAGRFDEADRLLEQAVDRETVAATEHQSKVAELTAARGDNAATQLHYADAAKHYEAAAGMVPSTRPDERRRYLEREAGALYQQGVERGDNKAALLAVDRYRAIARVTDRTAAPLDWAMTQMNLGTALSTLGERESVTTRLEEAVTAYRAALEERTRDRVPLDWAMTQVNLGNALLTLGEREGGTARLEEAVAAYRAALEETTRDRVPLYWAVTQNNLGTALETLGERESVTTRLEEAVAAYRAALEERTRDRVPLDWAMTQMNLGNALGALGKRESGTARLEEAVAAYRAALEETTRDRVPLQWAATQMNLGTALSTQGERESGTARLGEAVAAYRAALEETTRDRVPLYWAVTQNNLGIFKTLGERESGTARLEEAVAAFAACLTITVTAWPAEWVQEVRSHRAETRAEIARRQATK